MAVPGAAILAHALPSVCAIGALRRQVLPDTAGGRVALTFDDGPDPDSTPQFLSELDRLAVRATFFLLGAGLAAHPELGRRIADAGHEIAVHGWTHRPHVLRGPADISADLRSSFAYVREVTGAVPRWWRPPHGILTTPGLWVAHELGLRPVLWSADGREWRPGDTDAVLARLRRQTRPGGVVLLHDTDAESPSGSWRKSLGALPGLVDWCRARGWTLGPLAEHSGSS
jgi:peptidoglycan/xylan/chitin deacetylase (PgdA/CDA1 family)